MFDNKVRLVHFDYSSDLPAEALRPSGGMQNVNCPFLVGNSCSISVCVCICALVFVVMAASRVAMVFLYTQVKELMEFFGKMKAAMAAGRGFGNA